MDKYLNLIGIINDLNATISLESSRKTPILHMLPH